jgi:hypothetical protein
MAIPPWRCFGFCGWLHGKFYNQSRHRWQGAAKGWIAMALCLHWLFFGKRKSLIFTD